MERAELERSLPYQSGFDGAGKGATHEVGLEAKRFVRLTEDVLGIGVLNLMEGSES